MTTLILWEKFNLKIMQYDDHIAVIAGWSRHLSILYGTAVSKTLGLRLQKESILSIDLHRRANCASLGVSV